MAALERSPKICVLPTRSARSAFTALCELSTPEVTLNGIPDCRFKMPLISQPPMTLRASAFFNRDPGSCQTNDATNLCGILKFDTPRSAPMLKGLLGESPSLEPSSTDLLKV